MKVSLIFIIFAPYLRNILQMATFRQRALNEAAMHQTGRYYEGGGEGEGVFLRVGGDFQPHLQLRVARVGQRVDGSAAGGLAVDEVQVAALGAICIAELQRAFAGVVPPAAARIEISSQQRPFCKRCCQCIIGAAEARPQVAEMQLACIGDP